MNTAPKQQALAAKLSPQKVRLKLDNYVNLSIHGKCFVELETYDQAS